MNNAELVLDGDFPNIFLHAIIECWQGQYMRIDMKGGDDFLLASKKLVESILLSYDDAEILLLAFFVELGKRAKMWIEMERPDDSNPEKLIQTAYECIAENKIISSLDAERLFPLPEKRSGDVNIDEAYLVLHLLAHSLEPERFSEVAPSFFNFAITSQGVVIPEQQRRPLLRWCLEEGLPSVLSNKQPEDIADYLYSY